MAQWLAGTIILLLAAVFLLLLFYSRKRKVQDSLRLALDTAEAANKAKSIFLANMSHEIRTPLNGIIGFLELAKDDDVPQKTGKYLDRIFENAEWLLHIINDILDISKIESGKLELEHIPFSLHEIFMHCRILFEPKAEEKGLTLYCYAEPSIGKALMGDPIRLRQVLNNLLSNAVKFTNDGTVKLSATIMSMNENSVTINFDVTDTGIGMTPEQIEKMFKPFMQADSSITRKYGGTGLGIPITKSIVELMGGKLEVESSPEAGSKFSFALAFDFVDKPVDIQPRKIDFSETVKPVFAGEVLICEDIKMNQEIICEHLERVGLKTVVASNGKEGVDIVIERLQNGEKAFDLILMDIYMPVMDGLEAASKILELGTHTPIVAMTANVMLNDLELYRGGGIHDCLAKPFTSQELWKFLAKYLSVESLLITGPNDENIQKTADTEKILELMEKLESMLADNRAECVNLLGDIKAIPGAENLARCVEEFEFEQAITELSDLRKRLV